jgi:hypothetical protein
MGGNFLVPLVMWSWIPVMLFLFMRYPARKAIIVSFVVAWLFLPIARFDFPGIPDYTKMSATCYGILLATAIYDAQTFKSFRFHWVDVPILLWTTVSPFMSSITNGLGAYDGLSSALNQVITWGIPYFLGRMYINNLAALRDLAIAIFIGGLIYIPFCWYESFTFSSLHMLLYGASTGRDAAQSIRYGGYRPQVFLEHGLMLGVWLMSACLMGIALWKANILKRVWAIPISLWFVVLLATFVIARSTGAYLLFLIGTIILFVAWRFRTAALVWLLIASLCYYLFLGVSDTLPRKEIVGGLSQVFNAERVGSVEFRFHNEEILSARARQKIVFGWGGFGRNRVFNEYGEDISITDSLWIITFGVYGTFGLVTLVASILLPVMSFCVRYPARFWSHPNLAPAAALAVCVLLYMADCVLNAMVNPIFMLVAGGLAGLALQPRLSPTVTPPKRVLARV